MRVNARNTGFIRSERRIYSVRVSCLCQMMDPGTPDSSGRYAEFIGEKELPVPDESGTTDQMNLVFRWMRIYSVRKSRLCR